jgi:hypothetical protein
VNVKVFRQVLNGVLQGTQFCIKSIALVLVFSAFSASIFSQSVATSPKRVSNAAQAATQVVSGKVSSIQ